MVTVKLMKKKSLKKPLLHFSLIEKVRALVLVFEKSKDRLHYGNTALVSATGIGSELKSVRKNNYGEAYIDNSYAITSYIISGLLPNHTLTVYLAHNVHP